LVHRLGIITVKYIVEYIVKSGRKRERIERKRKYIIDYIVLSSILRIDTKASLYRRERGALTSNLIHVGQTSHIH
jgi:hypothetical protein